MVQVPIDVIIQKKSTGINKKSTDHAGVFIYSNISVVPTQVAIKLKTDKKEKNTLFHIR